MESKVAGGHITIKVDKDTQVVSLMMRLMVMGGITSCREHNMREIGVVA